MLIDIACSWLRLDVNVALDSPVYNGTTRERASLVVTGQPSSRQPNSIIELELYSTSRTITDYLGNLRLKYARFTQPGIDPLNYPDHAAYVVGIAQSRDLISGFRQRSGGGEMTGDGALNRLRIICPEFKHEVAMPAGDLFEMGRLGSPDGLGYLVSWRAWHWPKPEKGHGTDWEEFFGL